MYGLILTLHILICIMLIITVLIQSGKGAGIGGIFGGGGGSESLFSAPSGTTFIRKVTIGLAIGFVCATILLTILQSRRTSRSVLERVGIPQSQGQ